MVTQAKHNSIVVDSRTSFQRTQETLRELRSSGLGIDAQLHLALKELFAGRMSYVSAGIPERIEVAKCCLDRVIEVAGQWVDTAGLLKGIPKGHPARSEDVLTGPVVTARQLRLIIQGLSDIEKIGVPKLPRPVEQNAAGKLTTTVAPVKELFDHLVFLGFRGDVHFESETVADQIQLREDGSSSTDNPVKVTLILGAGNVTSIPLTDTLKAVFQDESLVLLKIHPLTKCLKPVFEHVLEPLIQAGWVRIIDCDLDVTQQAIRDTRVDLIHVTGSAETYNSIVWGPAGKERDKRLASNTPLISKPVTSELGCVSPWIMMPGSYSNRQLKFQAENVASSVCNNASFNCVATDVLITWKGWSKREQFLDLIDETFDAVPPRPAYYPGAIDRYEQFVGELPACAEKNLLPWTMIRGVDANSESRFFEQESFCCAFVEVAIDAKDEAEFLEKSVEFCNERLWGNLCAAVTVPNATKRKGKKRKLLDEQLDKLNYGSIGVNHWPGLIYAQISPPWGGAPGNSPGDISSGSGWGHNSYRLQSAQKTVLEGPLTVFPKPIWFPTHANPEPIAWKLLDLYHKPSPLNFLKLGVQSAKNLFA